MRSSALSQASFYATIVILTSTTHYDLLTFNTLVADFLAARNIELSDINTRDGGLYGRVFQDEALTADFCDYHKQHAQLRAIHWTANLSPTGRSPTP